MINAVNSGFQTPIARTEQSLTQNQQDVITQTLVQFDADLLSDSDAKSIVETFSSAGIQPGKALESAVAALGFDAKSIGELAGVEKPEHGNRPPPPPQQSNEEITELVDYLTQLLEETLSANSDTELSDEQKQTIYQQIKEKFGYGEDESIIDTTA